MDCSPRECLRIAADRNPCKYRRRPPHPGSGNSLTSKTGWRVSDKVHCDTSEVLSLSFFFFLRKLRQTKEEGREDNTPEVGDSAWVRWRDNGAELAALGLDGLISALSHLTGSTEDRDHLS